MKKNTNCKHALREFLQSFWRKNKRRIILSLLLVSLIILLLPYIAAAADATTQAAEEEWVAKTQKALVTMMKWVNKLLWIFLVVIGSLLDNSAIFGATLEPLPGTTGLENLTMEDQLLTIWVQIRNIVNIAFAVILLFVALYNVLGRTEGEFVLKSMLPRILIGLVVVNFSFLIGKVILDATNVMTVSMIALPMNANDLNFETIVKDSEENLCKYTVYKADGTVESSTNLTPTQLKEWGLTGICTTTGTFELKFKERFLKKFSHENLAFIITSQIAKLGKLKFLSGELSKDAAPETGEDYADAFIKLLLEIMTNLAIIIIYAVSIIALLLVLVVRVVVLWAMMAVSPLLVLFLVIPQLSQGMEEFDLKKTFVQHAIAPVIIVASLSIGFIMLESMIQYNVKLGTILDEETFQQSALKEIGFDRTGQFLAMIMGIVVIWLGVFGAASKTLAATVTDKLRDTVKAGAVMLAKLPTITISVPVTKMDAEGNPTGEKGDVSLHAGLQLLKGLPQLGEQKWFGPSAVKKELDAVGLGHLYSQGAAEMSELKNAKTGDAVKGMLGRVLVDFDWNLPTNVQTLKDKLKLALPEAADSASIDQLFTGTMDADKKKQITQFLKGKASHLGISQNIDSIIGNLNGTGPATPGSAASIQNATTYSDVLTGLTSSQNPTVINSRIVSKADPAVQPLLKPLAGIQSSNQPGIARALNSLLTDDDAVNTKRVNAALEQGKEWLEEPAVFEQFVDSIIEAEKPDGQKTEPTDHTFVTSEKDGVKKAKKQAAVEAAVTKMKEATSPTTPAGSTGGGTTISPSA